MHDSILQRTSLADTAPSPAPRPQRDGARRCPCGRPTVAGGECAACRPKRQARRGSSSGQPLDATTRMRFERRFGQDFSSVRVCADSAASKSAEAVDALAYTIGDDIVFGSGHLNPGTAAGQRLVAHELAHVVQQRGAGRSGGRTADGLHDRGGLEREADQAANDVMRSLGRDHPGRGADRAKQLTAEPMTLCASREGLLRRSSVFPWRKRARPHSCALSSPTSVLRESVRRRPPGGRTTRPNSDASKHAFSPARSSARI